MEMSSKAKKSFVLPNGEGKVGTNKLCRHTFVGFLSPFGRILSHFLPLTSKSPNIQFREDEKEGNLAQDMTWDELLRELYDIYFNIIKKSSVEQITADIGARKEDERRSTKMDTMSQEEDNTSS